MIKSQVAIVFF